MELSLALISWIVGALAVVGAVVVALARVLSRSSQRPELPPAEPGKTLPSAQKSQDESVGKVAEESVESLKPEVAAETVAPAQAAPVPSPVLGWRERLSAGLKRTQSQLFRGLEELFLSGETKQTREQSLEKLFETLIQADVGVATSETLVAKVRERLSGDEATNPERMKSILKEEIASILHFADTVQSSAGTIESPTSLPHVVMMVGVNGVGKTTTAGKLAFKASQRGQRAAVGAADTFRAAAVEQLKIWAERSNAIFVQLKEGADPASVAFESVKEARAQGCELCLVDTAGRLHNRQDLMQELAKIRRVMSKEIASAPHEVLLVLDATTGQNALQQAKVFRDLVQITGLVLTKLDGTAKGGVAIAIANEFKLPIRYIGVGESVEDLEPFRASEFVDALFATATPNHG